ncbi:DUF4271 domain-containing protein [Bacteroidota bacterium]
MNDSIREIALNDTIFTDSATDKSIQEPVKIDKSTIEFKERLTVDRNFDSIFLRIDRRIEKIESEKKFKVIKSVVVEKKAEIPSFNSDDIPYVINDSQLDSLGHQVLSNPIFFLDDKQSGQVITESKTKSIDLKEHSVNQRNREISGMSDLYLGLFLFSLILLVYVRLLYYKYLKAVFRSLFNFNLANSLFYDKNILLRRTSFVLNLVYYLNIGILLFFIIQYFELNIPVKSNFILLILSMSIAVILFFLKSLINWIVAGIFKIKEYVNEYIYNISLYNKSLGVLILPIIILITYLEPELFSYLLILGISLIILFYVMKLLRGIQIIFQKEVSIYYLILYLCTLEILPLIWLYKGIGIYQ